MSFFFIQPFNPLSASQETCIPRKQGKKHQLFHGQCDFGL